MTVLALARWKAALDPGKVEWSWPERGTERIFNGRLRKIERPIVGSRR